MASLKSIEWKLKSHAPSTILEITVFMASLKSIEWKLAIFRDEGLVKVRLYGFSEVD